ncbi:MAG TPA: Rossmann-like and DUF2520 domain-containing protein [Polyangiaceae bacterium]
MKGDPTVAIVGSGKVGSGLATALRRVGIPATLRKGRRTLPAKPFTADLLILAVRESALEPLAGELARRKLVGRRTAVVHCSGSLGPEPLSALRGIALGVAQMHPMISFASRAFVPTLDRGNVELEGDAAAIRVARRVARCLGMTPRSVKDLDRIAYHAAAGFLANGSAALAAAALQLLEVAGISTREGPRLLGPLLRSVADNVERLGLPAALTGPVRRGDAGAVERHLKVIESRAPELAPLYRALVGAQVPLARKLAEGEPDALSAMEQMARG